MSAETIAKALGGRKTGTAWVASCRSRQAPALRFHQHLQPGRHCGENPHAPRRTYRHIKKLRSSHEKVCSH